MTDKSHHYTKGESDRLHPQVQKEKVTDYNHQYKRKKNDKFQS